MERCLGAGGCCWVVRNRPSEPNNGSNARRSGTPLSTSRSDDQMSTEHMLRIPSVAVAQVVASVFDTMLGLDVAQCDAQWFPGGDRVTAALHLSGNWNGAVLLECDRRQACNFAGRFLSISPPDEVNDETRDVL